MKFYIWLQWGFVNLVVSVFDLWNNIEKMVRRSFKIMDRGKLIAIITGAISIAIAIAYLILVQLIDSRGEMIPAPISYLNVFLGLSYFK
jgi:hypothetical protein